MGTSTRSIQTDDLHRALAALSTRTRVRRTQRRWAVVLGAAALLVTAAIVLPGMNLAGHAAAEQPGQELPAERSVSVVRPVRETKQTELLLPAEVQAYQTTSIYARIAGYLKAWHVDRGARVKTGQLLAEIDAPEFDQELLRARSELEEGRASLAQSQTERDQATANLAATRANVLKAEANFDLAAKTVERFKDLEEKWAATRQQYDETVRNRDAARAEVTAAKANVGSFEAAVATREAAIRTAEARVSSLQANVRRLEQLESFKALTAPFNGVITRRGLDVGALISTDGSREIFSLAQDHILRVTANVPQSFAALIHEGQNAAVVAREFAQQDFAARVARTAGSIDSGSRTLAVELELSNLDRKLLPGAFTQVRFQVQDAAPAIRVAASTLRFTKDGTQVVAVDAERRLQPLPVKLGRDYGSEVEVLSGLSGAETLVVNPTDSMVPGERVQLTEGMPSKVAVK